MTRRVLLVEIGTPAELPVVTPPAPRPPSSWAPELPAAAVLPPPSGLSAIPVADGALLEWTPAPADGARSIVEAAADNDGTPGAWREVRRVDSGLYLLSIAEGRRWARVRAELNGRTSAPTAAVLCEPVSVADISDDVEDLEQAVDAVQALLDQEVADRIAEDLRVAGEAAADATAKANAALAQAQAAVDALAAEIGEIVNAPEWDPAEEYIAGWLVRYDGHLYRAIVDTQGDQPDVSPGEWELIGEYASLGDAVAAALELATQTATELEAEVARINALYARMPSGTDALATEAMMLSEAQALANQIGAEASRVDGLVARMPDGSGTLATQASVAAERTARVDAVDALAQDIIAVETIAQGAQSTAGTALTAANNAASAATTAQTTASGAQSTASSALTAANNAATVASSASTAAGDAQATASQALSVGQGVDGRLKGKQTLVLNVNGNISGTVSENDGTNSRFAILATIFELIASGSVGMEIRHPRSNTYYMRFYAAGAQAILGINFGASNNLVGWFGPNVGEQNCTTSNSTMHATNTGSAYFGGSLSAGVLRNAAQSTQVSNRATVETGRFGTNGNSKVVTFSLSYGNGGMTTSSSQRPTAGNISANVVLERRRNGSGSWVNVSSFTATGSIEHISEPGGVIVSIGLGGSSTFTDNSTGTQDFEYRARITSHSGAWPWINPVGDSGTQYLSVISIEE